MTIASAIAGENFGHRLWLKAVQPNEEVPKYFQRDLLAGLHTKYARLKNDSWMMNMRV